ncbi:MAG: glycosyltransferase [Pseudolabrys sp.]|nr:glycosyltransferase [Pseudolabrys sp.]
MNAPRVSVIMNGFNVAPYVEAALKSVFAQTWSDWEIVFWDNRSTDGTAEIVNRYANDKLHYYLAPSFTPLGEARNLAIRKSRGALIAFLDCDDLWLPEKLEKQVPLFDDPEVGLVYSDTVFFNARGDEKRIYNGVLPARGRCFKQLLGRYFLSMETIVLRRAALEQQPVWFDPRFNMIPDADLFRRIAREWKIDGVADALARWRVHGSSWTFKHPELFRTETLQMLETFRSLYPGFDADCAKELAELMQVIGLMEARDAWLRGDKWPLVRHFRERGDLKSLILALGVAAWPASLAAHALRLRGDVVPDEYFSTRRIGATPAGAS